MLEDMAASSGIPPRRDLLPLSEPDGQALSQPGHPASPPGLINIAVFITVLDPEHAVAQSYQPLPDMGSQPATAVFRHLFQVPDDMCPAKLVTGAIQPVVAGALVSHDNGGARFIQQGPGGFCVPEVANVLVHCIAAAEQPHPTGSRLTVAVVCRLIDMNDG